MRILVAGAGIGGLAAAVALRRAGHDVLVVERAPQLTEVGAGVGLQPHAMRCLDHLDVTPKLKHIGFPEKIAFLDMVDGRQLYETTLGKVGERLYGAPSAVLHRRDLIDALARQLPAKALRLDSEIVGAMQDRDGVRLTLRDGTLLSGDILVGADGLRSTVRTVFFGEAPRIFTGYLAWRTVVSAARFDFVPANCISIWLGAGRHVISYPIRDGGQVYAGCYVPADEALLEDWSKSGDVAELRKSFVDADPGLRRLIAGVDEAFITGIFYRGPLDSWRKGRVVLLGDAAHPVLPTSGSGAGLALEDAVSLAACLNRSPRDHEAAFAEFEARRKPRSSQVLATSRADLSAFHEDDEARRLMRGRIDAGVGRVDPTGRMRHSWLYCHDEVTESAKPYQAYLNEHRNPLRRPEARRAFELWRSAVQAEDVALGWMGEREAFRRFTDGLASLPAGTHRELTNCDGVEAVRIVPPGGENGPAVVYLPGNGHILGPSGAAESLAARIAQAVGGWALVPRTRMVPEHPAREVLADALRVCEWVAARADAWFLSGDGNGAGLAVQAAGELADKAAGRPLALYLLSPMIDMTLSADSIADNATTEAWLNLQRLLLLSAAWTQGDDPASPSLSPLHGGLGGLPPALIFAAAGEALADDARALVAGMRAAEGEAHLTLIEDSVHGFALFDFLPEARAFLDAVGADAAVRLADAQTAALLTKEASDARGDACQGKSLQ